MSEERGKKRWTPERRAEAAERMRQRHADPAYAVATAKRMRDRNADPVFLAKNTERMRLRNADPEFKAAKAERMRERARDPVFRSKMGWRDDVKAQKDIVRKSNEEKQRLIAARDKEICARRAAGMTLAQIGSIYSLSRQRVRMIVKQCSLLQEQLAPDP